MKHSTFLLLRTFVFLCTSMAGCSHSSVSEVGNDGPLVSGQKISTPAQLTKFMADTYARTAEMEYQLQTTEQTADSGIRIKCHAHHWDDGRLSLEVMNSSGKLIYTLTQEPVPPAKDRIRIQEHNLVTGEKADYTLTKDEFDYRRWDPHVADRMGFDACLFGAQLRSWLGPFAHEIDFFKRLVSNGSFVGVRNLGSIPCYVAATNRPSRRGEEIWINCENGLVQRWYDVQRDRVLHYQHHVMRRD